MLALFLALVLGLAGGHAGDRRAIEDANERVTSSATTSTTSAWHAQVKRNWPCDGCVTQLPPQSAVAPYPLVVVIHGDEGNPKKVFDVWKKPAADAGFVLFAPKCPRDQGCRGSWWRWREDPKWILEQTKRVADALPIDPARWYLAGWSGGTTYITLFAPRWFPPFSAVSLAGGGASPDHPGDCAACRAPVTYLQGDGNPLFWLAEYAGKYFRKCEHPLEWNQLHGADHAAEFEAYSAPAHVRATLAWMQAHAGACTIAARTEAPSASASAPAPSASAPEPAPRASAAPSPPRATPPQPAAPSHCACRAGGASSTLPAAAAAALAFALCAARRITRRRAPRCHGSGNGAGQQPLP